MPQLRNISVEAGIPLADIALAWPLHNPAVTCVIAGATKAEQVGAAPRMHEMGEIRGDERRILI